MSYADRVRAGVVLLDQQNPDWWRRIDVTRLDMGNCRRCVLGQLFGLFMHGADILDITTHVYGFEVDVRHQFGPVEEAGRVYELLTRLWTLVVRSRQERVRAVQHGATHVGVL